MASFQLPPLRNSEKFEHFVCELFNCIEKTDSYTEFQMFGVKGQNQKGVDIISQRYKTVIQCKAKGGRGNDESIRKKLIADIENDLIKVQELGFPFERMIFASTFRDDAQIQEHLSCIHAERKYSFSLSYLGWDTLTHFAEDHEDLLNKYFPQFRQKTSKSPLPDGALGGDLLRKNYVHYLLKRYGEWKQFELDRSREKFNYASFATHVISRYKAAGLNHIPISSFDDVATYLKGRIDKTIFGKNQKARGIKNYTTFEEYLGEIGGTGASNETDDEPELEVTFETSQPYVEIHYGANENTYLLRLKVENRGVRTLAGLEVYAYVETRFQNAKVPLTLRDENYELTSFNLPRGGERFVNLLQWRTGDSTRINLLAPPKYYPRNVFLIEPSATNKLVVEVIGGDMVPYCQAFSVAVNDSNLRFEPIS